MLDGPKPERCTHDLRYTVASSHTAHATQTIWPLLPKCHCHSCVYFSVNESCTLGNIRSPFVLAVHVFLSSICGAYLLEGGRESKRERERAVECFVVSVIVMKLSKTKPLKS
uniref:Uncharacterized protein n=1 Tax=Anopheles dirus TaxID=7168 RepID=A0A182NW17_9DIPT